MDLDLYRKDHLEDRSLGELFADKQFFCYTLEDAVRGAGIKIPGKTAIPADYYFLQCTWSPKFSRILPLIYNTEIAGRYFVVSHGISFEGVRLHGGNKPENSDACPLIGFKRNATQIWDSAADKLVALLGDDLHRLKIHN